MLSVILNQKIVPYHNGTVLSTKIKYYFVSTKDRLCEKHPMGGQIFMREVEKDCAIRTPASGNARIRLYIKFKNVLGVSAHSLGRSMEFSLFWSFKVLFTWRKEGKWAKSILKRP